MDPEEKFKLIMRNVQEVVTEEELKALLEKKKQPVVYIGTAITGKPHVAYFIFINKLADFLKAGFKVKLLLADLHGALDNTPWPLLEARYKYYNKIIPLMFKAIGANIKNFEIVRGSDFQLDKKYFYDVLRMSTFTSVHDCTKAASEIVKMGSSPKLSGLIYPIMQALDEVYLKVDIQYGGLDQRKILMFAREYLPKIGYQARIELMTPMIPGLAGGKMSASDVKSKIDLLDSPENVNTKLAGAYCPAGKLEDNSVLAFLKHVVMVLKEDKREELTIKRPVKFGGDISYKTYAELEKDFVAEKLHPQDLKNALAEEINKLLYPIREGMKGQDKLIKEAYPEEKT